MIRKFGAALALLSATAAQAQPLAGGACIPQAQAEDVLVAVLPGVVEAVGKRCGPYLGSAALLGGGAPAFAARLRADASEAWPRAQAVLSRVIGSAMPEFLSPDTLRIVAEQTAGAAAAAQLPQDQCARVERIVEPLAPLPPRNLARFTIAAVEGTKLAAVLPVRICTEARSGNGR